MDIQQELDRSIGSGPTLQAPSAHLGRGRRALRARRLRCSAGAAALAVVGGGYAMFVSTDDGSTAVASGTEGMADEFVDEVPYGLVDGCAGDPSELCRPMPVDFTATGELRRLPGTRIIALVIDPALRGEVEKSAGLDVEFEGERLWLSLQWGPGGSSSGREPAGTDAATFEEWLADPATFGGVHEASPRAVETLRWWNARTGEFLVPDDVTVLRRVDDPIGTGETGDSVGVVFELRGKRYWTLVAFVKARDGDHGESAFRQSGVTVGATDPERPSGDFDAWLRDQAAELRAGLRAR